MSLVTNNGTRKGFLNSDRKWAGVTPGPFLLSGLPREYGTAEVESFAQRAGVSYGYMRVCRQVAEKLEMIPMGSNLSWRQLRAIADAPAEARPIAVDMAKAGKGAPAETITTTINVIGTYRERHVHRGV